MIIIMSNKQIDCGKLFKLVLVPDTTGSRGLHNSKHESDLEFKICGDINILCRTVGESTIYFYSRVRSKRAF